MYKEREIYMKILVFGGTRFFGAHLVSKLISEGHKITIATRGQKKDNFGDDVQRVILDRTNENDLEKFAQSSEHFDVIYDQICYSPIEAEYICKHFKGKTDKLIFTSSQSVYPPGHNLTEDIYDPFSHKIVYQSLEDLGYEEAKRQAEAVYFQKAEFAVAAVRFPIVLGEDDYTQRLVFHIKRIRNELEIFFPNIKARLNFINSNEAGLFLAWLKGTSVKSPINACSNGTISLDNLMKRISNEVARPLLRIEKPTEENFSPFGIKEDWFMSNDKAAGLGFNFQNLEQWLPSLIATESKKLEQGNLT